MQWIHRFGVIKVPDHPVCVYFAIMICWHSLSSLLRLYLVHLNHLWYLCDAEHQEDRKQKNSRIWSDWFISMMSCEIRSSSCPCFLFLPTFFLETVKYFSRNCLVPCCSVDHYHLILNWAVLQDSLEYLLLIGESQHCAWKIKYCCSISQFKSQSLHMTK